MGNDSFTRIAGGMVKIGVSWDGGAAPGISGVDMVPLHAATEGVDPNGGSVGEDVSMLVTSAIVGVGTGLVLRASKKAQTTVGDVALDAFVGAELGTCFVSGPQAEAVCTGAVSALPLQLIEYARAKDGKWDFRYGVLTQGAASLVRSELGGNPIPFAGFTQSEGRYARPDAGELMLNGLVDVSMDAAVFALSNTAAALAQGKDDPVDHALAGAAYGGGVALAVNLVLGAPIRLSDEQIDEAVKNNLSHGGENVRSLFKYTTFRTGGLIPAIGTACITLGRNVTMVPDMINTETIGHEMVHRWQIAAPASGMGSLSFYGAYIYQAFGGYQSNPFERQAYFVGDGTIDGKRVFRKERLGEAVSE